MNRNLPNNPNRYQIPQSLSDFILRNQTEALIAVFDGLIVEANDAAARLFGYSVRSEIIGLNSESLMISTFKLDSSDTVWNCINKDGESFKSDIMILDWPDDGFSIIGIRSSTPELQVIANQQNALNLYRRLIQLLPIGSIFTDSSGRITYFNETAMTLTGYKVNEITDWTQLIHPDQTDIISQFEYSIKNGLPGNFPEVRLVKKDDTELWVSLWWHPMIDQSGNIKYFGFIFTDITEREKVKQELYNSEERFSSLLSNMPGAVFRCAYDNDWTMILISSGMEDISGYPASDIINSNVRSYDSIIHPDDRDMVNKTIHDAVEKKEAYSINYRIMHKDGSLRWVYERGQGVFDQNDKLAWLDGVIIDISDRKSAETALQQSEERYKSIVEHSSDVIVLTRPDGTLAYISPACNTVSGYEPEEFIDKDILHEKPNIFHPDDIKRIIEKYAEGLQGNRESNFEYRIITKTDEIRWVSHSWSPIYADDKHQMGVSVIRDITERKQIEETLVKARDDMEKAYQLQRQFLNNVTHEIRTPLTAIQGYAKMILEGLAGPITAEQTALLHKVVCSSNDLIEMVAGVLEIARLKSGILKLRTKACNLFQTIEKAVSLITPQAQQKGLKMSVNMPSLKSVGIYDEEKVHIILTNLLSNAVKFTNKGEIEVFVDSNKDGIEIVIADTGIGIDQAHLGSIFDEFSQLDIPKKHKPTGFGIGLAIVATMVNYIGATLTVSSKKDMGTAFTLYIPTLENYRSQE